jgi:arylsulfatase A-like enzyme
LPRHAEPTPESRQRARLRAAVAFGLVLATGESLAALAAGAREVGLFALQAPLAFGAGLVLFALPLSSRLLASLALSGVSLFHATFALHDLDRRLAALELVLLAFLGALLALGSFAFLRDRAGACAERERVLVFAGGYLVQGLWCASLLFPSTDTSSAWVLPLASASAVAAPLAGLLVARRLVSRPRSTAGLAAAALLVAAPPFARGAVLWRAHRLAPAPGQVAGAQAPDVLLIVLDTVRADRLSLYGHIRPTTPSLERLAARATVYERAQSQGIWTVPGHASLFTGLYPSEHQAEWKHGVDWCRPLRAEAVTLAERFAAAGYRTASIAANPFLGRTFGLAQGFEWQVGGRSPTVYLWVPALAMGLANLWDGPRARQRLGPLERTSTLGAVEINERALAWLARTRGEGPRFLFLNYMEAHDQLRLLPCAAPRYGEERSWIPDNLPQHRRVWAGKESLAPEDAARLLDWYDSEIACLDLHLGELLDALERRGLLDGMLVAVTADHGHLLGEHDAFNHEAEVWRELTHVPLLVKRPFQRAGERCAVPAQTSDLALLLPWLAGLDLGRVPAHLGRAEPRARIARLGEPGSGSPCPLLPGAGTAVSESPERLELAQWNPRYATRWTGIVDGPLKFFVDGAERIQVTDEARVGLERLRAPSAEELERARALLDAWRAELIAPLGAEPSALDERAADEEAAERLRLLEQQGYAGR